MNMLEWSVVLKLLACSLLSCALLLRDLPSTAFFSFNIRIHTKWRNFCDPPLNQIFLSCFVFLLLTSFMSQSLPFLCKWSVSLSLLGFALQDLPSTIQPKGRQVNRASLSLLSPLYWLSILLLCLRLNERVVSDSLLLTPYFLNQFLH